MRKRTEDLEELIHIAVTQVARALHDGDEKYPPGSWKEEAVENHIAHLVDHMRELQGGKWYDSHGHAHISHVICRAVMIAALRVG